MLAKAQCYNTPLHHTYINGSFAQINGYDDSMMSLNY